MEKKTHLARAGCPEAAGPQSTGTARCQAGNCATPPCSCHLAPPVPLLSLPARGMTDVTSPQPEAREHTRSEPRQWLSAVRGRPAAHHRVMSICNP